MFDNYGRTKKSFLKLHAVFDPLKVIALRTILKEEVSKRQGAGSSTGYTYMSGDQETVESTSVATMNHPHQMKLNQRQAVVVATTTAMVAANDSDYMINYDPASSVPTPSYSNWAVLPSYP